MAGTTDDRNDPGLKRRRPDGMQDTYLVLSEEERAKGFVRPVRTQYIHAACEAVTWMSQDLAETYARQPNFYTGTWCARCKFHAPVGPAGEFRWIEADGLTGPKVGT